MLIKIRFRQLQDRPSLLEGFLPNLASTSHLLDSKP